MHPSIRKMAGLLEVLNESDDDGCVWNAIKGDAQALKDIPKEIWQRSLAIRKLRVQIVALGESSASCTKDATLHEVSAAPVTVSESQQAIDIVFGGTLPTDKERLRRLEIFMTQHDAPETREGILTSLMMHQFFMDYADELGVNLGMIGRQFSSVTGSEQEVVQMSKIATFEYIAAKYRGKRWLDIEESFPEIATGKMRSVLFEELTKHHQWASLLFLLRNKDYFPHVNLNESTQQKLAIEFMKTNILHIHPLELLEYELDRSECDIRKCIMDRHAISTVLQGAPALRCIR